MQSNGGRLPVTGMRRNAISALFSGPAAGVVGATRQAQRSAIGNLITFDMGGTLDRCLSGDRRTPGISPDTVLDGLPVRTPVLDIATIGAGGGSLVWVDDGGMLRVGPRSAAGRCWGRPAMTVAARCPPSPIPMSFAAPSAPRRFLAAR